MREISFRGHAREVVDWEYYDTQEIIKGILYSKYHEFNCFNVPYSLQKNSNKKSLSETNLQDANRIGIVEIFKVNQVKIELLSPIPKHLQEYIESRLSFELWIGNKIFHQAFGMCANSSWKIKSGQFFQVIIRFNEDIYLAQNIKVKVRLSGKLSRSIV